MMMNSDGGLDGAFEGAFEGDILRFHEFQSQYADHVYRKGPQVHVNHVEYYRVVTENRADHMAYVYDDVPQRLDGDWEQQYRHSEHIGLSYSHIVLEHTRYDDVSLDRRDYHDDVMEYSGGYVYADVPPRFDGDY
jgi:hypothetical protein